MKNVSGKMMAVRNSLLNYANQIGETLVVGIFLTSSKKLFFGFPCQILLPDILSVLLLFKKNRLKGATSLASQTASLDLKTSVTAIIQCG